MCMLCHLQLADYESMIALSDLWHTVYLLVNRSDVHSVMQSLSDSPSCLACYVLDFSTVQFFVLLMRSRISFVICILDNTGKVFS